jgi:NADPH-dependent ferric siderophore reductase
MMESLPSGAVAVALVEIDTPADEQVPDAAAAAAVDLRWLHRQGQHEPGDPELLVEAAAAVVWPTGGGHAYVAAEARVVRAVAQTLESRGVGSEQISPKAYWRRGLPNAEHGEPTRD